jgi:glycogen synthase
MDRQMGMNIAAKASFESQWFFQVPVVRKTGGLAGTVLDMDDLSSHEIANG